MAATRNPYVALVFMAVITRNQSMQHVGWILYGGTHHKCTFKFGMKHVFML